MACSKACSLRASRSEAWLQQLFCWWVRGGEMHHEAHVTWVGKSVCMCLTSWKRLMKTRVVSACQRLKHDACINNKQLPWTLNRIFEHPEGCHFVNLNPRRILCSIEVRFWQDFPEVLAAKAKLLAEMLRTIFLSGLVSGWSERLIWKFLQMTCYDLCISVFPPSSWCGLGIWNGNLNDGLWERGESLWTQEKSLYSRLYRCWHLHGSWHQG